MLRTLLLPLAVVVFASVPRFAPSPGAKASKSLEWTIVSHLDSWKATMGGNPVPPQYLPQLELDGKTVRRLEWNDEWLACADGAPLRLRRKFGALAATETNVMKMNGQAFESERKATSPLAGCTVLFDERAKPDARRVLESGECASETLEALTIDLDFTGFLAGAGDKEWTVGTTAFNPFDKRFGGLNLEWDTPSEDTHVDDAQLASNAKGEWKVRPSGARTQDGRELVVLSLEGRFTTSCELDGELEHVPVASGPTREVSTLTLEVEGELLWDARASIPAACTLAGKQTLLHVTRTVAETDGKAAYEQRMEFSGTVALDFRVTPQ